MGVFNGIKQFFDDTSEALIVGGEAVGEGRFPVGTITKGLTAGVSLGLTNRLARTFASLEETDPNLKNFVTAANPYLLSVDLIRKQAELEADRAQSEAERRFLDGVEVVSEFGGSLVPFVAIFNTAGRLIRSPLTRVLIGEGAKGRLASKGVKGAIRKIAVNVPTGAAAGGVLSATEAVIEGEDLKTIVDEAIRGAGTFAIFEAVATPLGQIVQSVGRGRNIAKVKRTRELELMTKQARKEPVEFTEPAKNFPERPPEATAPVRIDKKSKKNLVEQLGGEKATRDDGVPIGDLSDNDLLLEFERLTNQVKKGEAAFAREYLPKLTTQEGGEHYIKPHSRYIAEVSYQNGKREIRNVTGQEALDFAAGKNQFIMDVKEIAGPPKPSDIKRGMAEIFEPATLLYNIKEGLKNTRRMLLTPHLIGDYLPQLEPLWNKTYKAFLTATGRRNAIRAVTQDFKFLQSMEGTAQRRIAKTIQFANIQKKAFSDDVLKTQFTLGAEEIGMVKQIRQHYAKAQQLVADALKVEHRYDKMNLPEKAQFDVKLRQMLLKNPAFASNIRTGRFNVAVEKPKVGKGGKVLKEGDLIRFQGYDSLDAANKAAAGIRKGDPSLRINVYDSQKVKHPRAVVEGLSEFDFKRLVEDAGVDLPEALMKQFDEVFKARRLDRIENSFIPRKNIQFIEDTPEEFVRRAEQFASAASRKLERAMIRSESDDLIQQLVKSKHFELASYAQEYRDLLLRGDPRQLAWARKGLGLWMLAGNPKFIALNLTQPLQTTFPETIRQLSAITAQGKFAGDAGRSFQLGFKVFSDSYKETMEYMMSRFRSGPKDLSMDPFTRKLVARAQREGLAAPVFTQEFIETTTTNKGVMGAIGSFTAAPEEVNRLHAVVSASKIAQLRNMSPEGAYDLAISMVNRTQFPFGFRNLPPVVSRDKNQIGRALFTFQSFGANMWMRLYRTAFSKELEQTTGVKAAEILSTLGALGALGGISALPFFGLFKWGFQQRGFDPEFLGRKALTEAKVPGAVQDVVFRGLPTLGGVDLSRSVELNLPLFSGGPVGPVPGVIGSIVSRFGRGMQKVGRAASLPQGTGISERLELLSRALEDFSPVAIRNVLVAARQDLREGERTKSGELVFKPTLLDTITRSLGFQPKRLTKARAAREFAFLRKEFVNNRQRILDDQRRKARAKGEFNIDRQLVLHAEIHNRTAAPEDLIRIKTPGQLQLGIQKIKGNIGLAQKVPKSQREIVALAEELFTGKRGAAKVSEIPEEELVL